MRADLHTHSSYSDGVKTPSEIVAWAVKRGLEALAITDHDSVSGVGETLIAGGKAGIKIVPGIELSTFSIYEIHILGYNIDFKNEAFKEEVERIKNFRKLRNMLIGEKLESLGIKLGIDYGADGLGRMNIARVMVGEKYVSDVNEAFDKYLGTGKTAYVASKRLTPIEAVNLIKKYGGFSSIAHPKQYLLDNRLEMLAAGLIKSGLNGLEVYYPSHNEKNINTLLRIAQKLNLLATGGSDYHGEEDKNFDFSPDKRLIEALKLR